MKLEDALRTAPPVLQEEVYSRIREIQARRGANWPGSFFNNFEGNLPGGYRRSEQYLEGPETDEIEPCPNHSVLRNTQSLRQFQAAIDTTIQELGASATEIEQFIQSHLDDDPTKCTYATQDPKFLELCFPVYVRLRQHGYNHGDLTN